jgi:hypothetical protein
VTELALQIAGDVGGVVHRIVDRATQRITVNDDDVAAASLR